MKLKKLPTKGERINGDLVLAVRSEAGRTEMLWRGKWQALELPQSETLPHAPSIPAVQPVTTEPDPYPVGTRLYLRNWFEAFDPDRYQPERWEVIEPANQHGLYLLRSDSGNWASLSEFCINRDLIKR